MATFVEFSAPVNAIPFQPLFAAAPRATIELERIVPTGDGLCPYVWIRGASPQTVARALTDSATGIDLTLVDDPGDADRGALYRTDWDPDGEGLVTAIADSTVTVLTATGTRDGWTVRIRADDHDHLRSFQRRCDDRAVGISIDRLQPLEYVSADDRLTTPQLEALELAFRRGYFDDPRRVTLDDLAADLEITRQSLAGRLRRGHRNLLAGVFGSDGPPLERVPSHSFAED